MSRPKGSKNKKKTIKTKKTKKIKKVRKVGRPKGSKIKKKVGRPKKKAIKAIKSVKAIKVKKKVGRPSLKKKQSISKYNDLPDDYVQPKTHKVAGYCPKCDLCIMSSDFVSKMIFECPCGTKKHKRHLLVKSKRTAIKEKTSKKQYLRDAAQDNKHIELHHKSSHHTSNVPDVSIMSEVKD